MWRRVLALALISAAGAAGPCRDGDGAPRRCAPDFVDAALGRPVAATCGPACQDAARLLTDPTGGACWSSGPEASRALNLTVSLGRRFELTYVSVRFCGAPPERVALFKSADHGRSWRPFHTFADACGSGAAAAHEQAAFCSPLPRGEGAQAAFSTLEGRPSAASFDRSPVLQDWVTATDVRVALLGAPPFRAAALSVGGRCKCNGHASRCGPSACECEHNTAGRDCERCRDFHFDRPWGRATEEDVKECVECQCNQHARRCRFSVELFRSSGSGGLCQGCRHHTAGHHCHLCQDGYYRDARRPIAHRKACIACGCHPVGSLDPRCDQTSGQCPCKKGVTGRTCSQCAKGYHQGLTTAAPCVRSQCGECPPSLKKLTLRKYCQRDYAVQASVLSRETIDEWTRFGVSLIHIFKAGPAPMRPGTHSLWVSRDVLDCGCVRIRPGRDYLIMGSHLETQRYSGLQADLQSLVLPWREDWSWRLRRLQRRQRNGRCQRFAAT